MKTKKTGSPPYYLLTGLFFGLLAGLVLALVFRPVYVDASPAAMGEIEKITWRALVAQAYAADRDLGRAKARLALLQDKNIINGVAVQAQQELSGNGPENDRVKALALLATAFAPTYTPDLSTPTPEQTPTSTITATLDTVSTTTPTLDLYAAIQTATPVITVTATQAPTETEKPADNEITNKSSATTQSADGSYSLEKESAICDPNLEGLIQIEVMNKYGDYKAGVSITITWDGGEDRFYTGLHPHINRGYADFDAEANREYLVKIGENNTTVEKLSLDTCTNKDGSTYGGGLTLIFREK